MNAPSFNLLGRHAPEALVALGGAGRRSRAHLLADVHAVARALPAPEPGGEILVICGDRYHVAVGVLAAWQAGHAVALPPNGQEATVRALAAADHVLAFLHDTDASDGVDVRSLLTSPSHGVVAEGPALAPVDADRHVATLYTSGSTGAHQPCPKAARQLLGEALAQAEAFAFGPHDLVMPTVPPHHIYGLLFGVLAPLLSGAAFARTTPLHAETIARLARETAATMLVSVPAHLRSLADLEPGALPAFRRVLSSAAPLSEQTARLLAERFALVVTEVFGSSETGGIAYRQQLTSPLWQPLPGVTVTAADDGRLLLDSPFLEAEAPRPYACADQIQVLPDGRFRHLGRADGVAKIGGKRVAVAALEQRLQSLRGVRDAAILARPVDGPRGTELLALVAAESWTLTALRRQLARWFDPAVLPRRVRFVEALPREDNGKLTRARFLEVFEATAAPRTTWVRTLQPRALDAPTVPGVEVDLSEVALPATYHYFRGHFDGFPILPGAVQLEEIVARRSRTAWADLERLRSVDQLRFRRLVRPGDVLRLQLRRPEGSSAVGFEVRRGDAVCCEGTLVFEEAGA